jgi:hypothetical protein
MFPDSLAQCDLTIIPGVQSYAPRKAIVDWDGQLRSRQWLICSGAHAGAAKKACF